MLSNQNYVTYRWSLVYTPNSINSNILLILQVERNQYTVLMIILLLLCFYSHCTQDSFRKFQLTADLG